MNRRARSSNRTWAGLAGLAALALVVVYVSLEPPPLESRESRPSSFFSNDTGAKGGYLVLKEIFGDEVLRWRHLPSLLNLLDGPEAVTSLIVLGPSLPLTPKQADALDRWMSEGGQLIIATDGPWPVLEAARPFQSKAGPDSESEESGEEELETRAPQGEETESDPVSGDFLTRHGFQVLSAEGGGEAEAPLFVEEGRLREGGHTVLATGADGALAGSLDVGEGRLVVIPDPLAFSNQRLRRHPRNMTFLVRLLEDAPYYGRIAVDEYHHGFEGRRPFMAVLRGFLASAWGLASLQLGAAGLLYLLGVRRRFGTVLEPPPAPVRDPLALVEARAGLLQAAEARSLAVELIDRHGQRRRSGSRSGGGDSSARDPEYRRILRDAQRGRRLRDTDLPVFARIAEESARRQH